MAEASQASGGGPSGAGEGSGGRARRGWTWRRRLGWAAGALVGLLVAGELASRFVLGLGDPPLFQLDPAMEYVLVPSRSYRRFGNDFRVNRYSMRADDFPERKASPDELRVLVIGDSIVNGGSRLDQRDLATEVLKRRLSERLHRPVTVGNASAGSWGPPNELAWLEKYGTLDADVVLLVFNSNDEDDVPGLDYIGMAWPTRKPTLALEELVGNYGWKALCKALGRPPEPPPPPHTTTHEQDVEACRRATLALIARARSAGARVGVVQWLKHPEIDAVLAGGGPEPGWAAMGGWAREAGVPVFQAADRIKPAVAAGQAVYFDGDVAHPNAHGHALLGETLLEATEALLKDGAPAPPAG
jgi:hypothetical protein